MIENRKYHRINLTVDAKVYHQVSLYEGIIGSISLGGALINFNDSAMIPQGDLCYISFDLCGIPLKLEAKIVNSSVRRVGVAFVDMSYEHANMLAELLIKLTSAPESQQSDNILFFVT